MPVCTEQVPCTAGRHTTDPKDRDQGVAGIPWATLMGAGLAMGSSMPWGPEMLRGCRGQRLHPGTPMPPPLHFGACQMLFVPCARGLGCLKGAECLICVPCGRGLVHVFVPTGVPH